MAPHSSTLAWKIPWTKEPGGLQSMGLLRATPRLSNFTFTFHFYTLEKEMATHSSVLAWRVPGTVEPVGCSLWGCTELDTTEATQQQQQRSILRQLEARNKVLPGFIMTGKENWRSKSHVYSCLQVYSILLTAQFKFLKRDSDHWGNQWTSLRKESCGPSAAM